jgi:hypothetical protein
VVARSKRWPIVWRLGLIGFAIVLVIGSAVRIKQDVCQGGPFIHNDAPSQTMDADFNPEFSTLFDAPAYAQLGINFSALNAANSSITAQLAIELDQALVSRLVLLGRSARSPVNASDSRQWMGLPVTLHLVLCSGVSDPDCTIASLVQMRLGDLLVPEGRGVTAATVTRQLDLFADANPSAYPQDEYAVTLYPGLFLPSGVELTTSTSSSSNSLPIHLILSKGTGLADKHGMVLYGGRNDFGYQVVFSRLGLDQSLAYGMALTPALLGFLVLFLAFSIREAAGSLDFRLTAILGLLAAWLTILPLRAVLVPQELGATPSTRIDDILIFDAALVLLFTVGAFAWVTRPSRH